MAAAVIGLSTTTRSHALSASEFCGWQRRIDALCDQFEDAWQAGEEPRSEDYLADCDLPPSRQGALLCELLKLERELRQQRGAEPTASMYLERFPSHANIVRAVFGEPRLGTYEL